MSITSGNSTVCDGTSASFAGQSSSQMDHGYHSYAKIFRRYKQQHHEGLLMEYAMLRNSICSKMGRTNQHVSFQNPACLVKSDNWCMVYHGWWFQTSILFSTIWDVILPIDELHHFSEGWLNHQAVYPGLSISSGLTLTWIWLISPLDHPDIGIPFVPIYCSKKEISRIVSISQQVLWGAK